MVESSGAKIYSGQPYAISMNDGAKMTFNGNVDQPEHVCRVCSCPREGGKTNNWANTGWMGAIMFMGSGNPTIPQISGFFTTFADVAARDNFFRDAIAAGIGGFQNCEFYNGGIGTYNMQYLNFTNCLFYRDCVTFWDQNLLPLASTTRIVLFTMEASSWDVRAVTVVIQHPFGSFRKPGIRRDCFCLVR